MILAEGGPPAVEAVLLWGGAVTVVAGVVTVLWRLGRGVAATWQRLDQFIEDWYGEGPRPGVPARPGVLERVTGMELRLSRMEHELHPNDGGSLRDAIDEANRRLTNLCPDRDTTDRRPPDGS
ncbi:hypothetical protein [Streptomyces griseus]|uniref:hypothetical protein n=1 Tax=Streptomyces griseus TaxID=1911 RepID=UPI000A39952D|nr:hypothetical protein [Streptomyces fimicarius]